MLNGYDGYLPNTTIETVYNGQSQLFYGNSNGPSFESGNYPLVRSSPCAFRPLFPERRRARPPHLPCTHAARSTCARVWWRSPSWARRSSLGS